MLWGCLTPLVVIVGLLALAYIVGSSEEVQWTTAKKENAIPRYKKFIDQFPNGKHAQEAKQALAERREQERASWLKVDRDANSENIKAYLEAFPEGEHALDVKKKGKGAVAIDMPALEREFKWRTEYTLKSSASGPRWDYVARLNETGYCHVVLDEVFAVYYRNGEFWSSTGRQESQKLKTPIHLGPHGVQEYKSWVRGDMAGATLHLHFRGRDENGNEVVTNTIECKLETAPEHGK